MRTFKFARELQFQTDGNTFILKRLIEDTWQAENQRTGAFHQFSISTLKQLYAESKLQLAENTTFNAKTKTIDNALNHTFLDNMNAIDREYVIAKRYFLTVYQKNYGGIKTPKAMAYAIEREWGNICKSHPKPSASAALKWLSKFEQSGNDTQSLVMRYSNCGNRNKRITYDIEQVCLKVIHEDFMTTERHSLAFVLNKAIHLVTLENQLRPKSELLEYPTISTFRSVLKAFPEEEIYASRFGEEAARNKYRTSIGSTYANKPLSVIEIDHTRLDIIAVDELTGLPVDRPWLTVVLDVFTRCILGFYLCYEPPSHASVAAALKHAIMPKEMHAGIHGHWPMHGIPSLMVVDNGLEFHGDALKAFCAEVGMNISFCPRKRGWSKGSVERVIGTINRKISEIVPSGKTFASIKDRGDYDSVAKACVSLEALRLGMAKLIVDVYHETIHRGIQCKPIDRWKMFINNEDIQLPVHPEKLDAITGNIDSRSLFHYGIEINNATYNSEELMKYRSHFKGKAVVRWNSMDLGHVYVMVHDGPMLTVPVHPSKHYLKGMSLFAWKIIQRQMKHASLDPNNAVAVASMVHELTEMMSANAKKNKQTRQSHLRLKNGTQHIKNVISVETGIETDSETMLKPIPITKMSVHLSNQTNL